MTVKSLKVNTSNQKENTKKIEINTTINQARVISKKMVSGVVK